MSKKIEHASNEVAKTGGYLSRELRISNDTAWPNLAIRGGRNRQGVTQ